MTKKNILVTGGAGYIGSHTCKALKENGFTPIVFDNLSTGHLDFIKWGPFVKGDLLNIADIEKAFLDYEISAVMHFAAKAIVSESMKSPNIYYQNNFIGAFNLIESMRKAGVKHFVFSSTCATYGDPEFIPLTESHPLNPISPYGYSKLMVEKLLHDYKRSYDISSASLRYFNAAGADLFQEIGEKHFPETHLIPLVIDTALNIYDHFKVFGTDFKTKDGSAIRDFIHVDDLADAHIRALLYLFENNKNLTVNLGTGCGFSVYEIIDAIKKYSKKEIIVKKTDKRFGDPPILIADNKKAKEYLGWELKHSNIETIIESAWKWHEKKAKK
jgi:UDP-glucose-4-epimerase GalE